MTTVIPEEHLGVRVRDGAPEWTPDEGWASAPPRTPGRTTQVIALVPAHNEQADIAETVRSLLGQTEPPERVIVMADNCTDATAERAREAGALVYETVANRARKSGALNQGLHLVLEELDDGDVVLVMDADSQLAPDFIEHGLRHLAAFAERGAISGSYFARHDQSLVALLQRLEYVQGLRTVRRRNGRIHVLSGAAGMFVVGALRAVADRRGRDLPGVRGWVYHQESLTEDYELTVALKLLGYQPLCVAECAVVTDVMTTWKAWKAQRLRWQRGTLETLLMYGWVPHTRKTWVVMGWTYFRSLIPLMMVVLWTYAFLFEEIEVHLFWLAIVPVFVLDQVVSSWRAGRRGRIFAALIGPMWAYDLMQATVNWRALWLTRRGSEAVWIT